MWKALFFVAFASTLYLFGLFANQLHKYISLNEAKQIQISEWQMEPGNDETFYLNAAFELNGKKVHYQFKEKFANEFLAEEAIEGLRKQPWTVWIKAGDSSQLTLQKEFPLKEFIHFILAFLVSVYFVWLKIFTRQFRHDLP